MFWPALKTGARLLQVTPDEAEGELFIMAAFDGETEREIVYEGMFYSQLDECSAGITVTRVTEIKPNELNQPNHAQAAARLYRDCSEGDAFLRDMHRRGNHLYVHQTEDGGEYIVLAKRLAFGESRPIISGGI